MHTAHSMLRCARLADPETAYRCTELAVKLHRKQMMGGGSAMAAAAAAMQQMARGESSLTERLARLEDLKKRGVLTEEVRTGNGLAGPCRVQLDQGWAGWPPMGGSKCACDLVRCSAPHGPCLM